MAFVLPDWSLNAVLQSNPPPPLPTYTHTLSHSHAHTHIHTHTHRQSVTPTHTHTLFEAQPACDDSSLVCCFSGQTRYQGSSTPASKLAELFLCTVYQGEGKRVRLHFCTILLTRSVMRGRMWLGLCFRSSQSVDFVKPVLKQGT